MGHKRGLGNCEVFRFIEWFCKHILDLSKIIAPRNAIGKSRLHLLVTANSRLGNRGYISSSPFAIGKSRLHLLVSANSRLGNCGYISSSPFAIGKSRLHLLVTAISIRAWEIAVTYIWPLICQADYWNADDLLLSNEWFDDFWRSRPLPHLGCVKASIFLFLRSGQSQSQQHPHNGPHRPKGGEAG